MKKLLLSLATLAISATANADEVTFVAQGASYSGDNETTTISNITGGSTLVTNEQKETSFTCNDIEITFVKYNSSNSQVNGNQVRWYQSDEIVITPLNGASISGVTMNAVSSYYNTAVTISGEGVSQDNNTLTTGNATRTWTAASGSKIIDPITLKAGAQTRFTYLTVEYVLGEPASVASPVINVEQGSSQYTVTMTCATDGAEIYYTTDGETVPTANSTKYTEPIVLKSLDNTTFKAIAILGDDQSNVVTRTVEVPLLTTELSAVIEAMTALGKNETVDFVYTGKLTYVYKGISGNNAYLYLTDGTDNVLLFGSSNVMTDYVEGTTYTSLAGSGQNYNGLPEVTNFTLGGLATGAAAVQPVAITSIKDNIDADHMNAYYEISNVSIQGTTMTDSEGNEIALYNRFNITIPEGNKLLVRGFVAAYNNVQFYPTYIESMAQVFNPEFSLEDGEYADGTVVTISCDTEGATIVYTINDGDVIKAPAPVKIILTEDVTIEAYATKEGLEDSDVVEATYTVKKYEIEGNSATFEFSTEAFQTSWVEPLDEAFVYPNENVLNFDGKYVFINNGVQLAFSKGSNSNNGTCLYTSGNGQLRDYTGNQIIVSILSSAYYITNVTFVHGTSNYGGFTTEQGSMNSDKDSWTATDKNTNSITFTVAANNRIDGINVEFEAIDTAVEGINADEVAPVYYNLQGVKVANPEKGIYIVVKGDKTSKVIF